MQNRPYINEPLMVTAIFEYEVEEDMGSRELPMINLVRVPKRDTLTFNWNNREEVRNFAAQSDRIIRMGGKTTVGQNIK